MSHPLPLVTATFTTDEMAKFSAGLMLLRRRWASVMVSNPDDTDAPKIVQGITDLINRMAGLITKEQGNALLQGLISLQKEKSDE